MVKVNEGDPTDKSEPLFKPELIREHPFRIPSICREGDAYQFKNLRIPTDWMKRVTELGGSVPDTGVELGYVLHNWEVICEPQKSSVEVDEKTHVITHITVPTKSFGESQVILRHGWYLAENIYSIDVATALLSFLNGNLSFSYPKPYRFEQYVPLPVETLPRLAIPKRYLDEGKEIFNDYSRYRFTMTAHNIAGQFGEHLDPTTGVGFDKTTGILCDATIAGTSANTFLHERELNEGWYYYSGNNRDTTHLRIALHAIVATFLNELMEREEHR